MSAVNGKKSIKRQKKWRAEQNTEARLEAAALIVVQESPTRRGMSRARIKSGWTENNELRVLLESGASFGGFMLITHNYSTKNPGWVRPCGAKSVLGEGHVSTGTCATHNQDP